MKTPVRADMGVGRTNCHQSPADFNHRIWEILRRQNSPAPPTGTTGTRFLKITAADGNFLLYDEELTPV